MREVIVVEEREALPALGHSHFLSRPRPSDSSLIVGSEEGRR